MARWDRVEILQNGKRAGPPSTCYDSAIRGGAQDLFIVCQGPLEIHWSVEKSVSEFGIC